MEDEWHNTYLQLGAVWLCFHALACSVAERLLDISRPRSIHLAVGPVFKRTWMYVEDFIKV